MSNQRKEVYVAQDGTAQFRMIQEAIDAVPWEQPAVIYIAAGDYREKIFCDKKEICLIGQGAEKSRLWYDDGAYHIHADGMPNGTFRSYTAFFKGEKLFVKGLAIENCAGDGAANGQAIAAAVETEQAVFCDAKLISYQDTLFTGPLPKRERLPDGFLGPSQFSPRLPSMQYYSNCVIQGDIDFIFGGADVLFAGCTLLCKGSNRGIGYIAAPSTLKNALGYIFYQCIIKGEDAAAHSFYLARPWRKYGAAAFLECTMGEVVCPDGFDDWGDKNNRDTSRFVEFANTGQGAQGKRAFGQKLLQAEGELFLQQVLQHFKKLIDSV